MSQAKQAERLFQVTQQNNDSEVKTKSGGLQRCGRITAAN
jgi:hypothetical protein